MNRYRRPLLIGGVGAALLGGTAAVTLLTGHGAARAASTQTKSVTTAAQPVQAAPAAATDPDAVNDTTTPDTAVDPSSQAEAGTSNDGPGGHADNPADPNVQHEFQGNE